VLKAGLSPGRRFKKIDKIVSENPKIINYQEPKYRKISYETYGKEPTDDIV
jgi:hypothetical protein